ncbi:MAG: CBS domain-containing protein [Candidatus Micrarchaeota archaeon]|nr:CBS domain-containing protein [Candidatus Micrarchaeota archaeon]MCX8154266.1 CBS domain-containing protein [Candidatus Micrarchaeota archaeon]
MNLKRILKRNVLYVQPETPIYEAAKLMRDRGQNYVIVIDNGKAQGIVTRTDIVYRAVAERKDHYTKISEIMSSPLIVLFPEMSVDDAVRAFNQHPIHRIVIIDRDSGKLLGVVEKDDIFKIISSNQ